MSNELIDKNNDFKSTDSLRETDLFIDQDTLQQEPKEQPHQFKVKPVAPNPSTHPEAHKEPEKERTYTAAEVIEISKQVELRIREQISNGSLQTGATQVLPKTKVPVKAIDYTKLTMDDIYDLSIPIQAKTFGATDALRVDLVDKNYEARWVNKNPRRLGQFLAYGFTYVEAKDLARKLEVEVVADAQGHFCLDDVVLMRIPKEKYYAALRAAHERAVKTVNQVSASKAAEKEATEFMTKAGGAEFAEAVSENKMSFYRPGIEI